MSSPDVFDPPSRADEEEYADDNDNGGEHELAMQRMNTVPNGEVSTNDADEGMNGTNLNKQIGDLSKTVKYLSHQMVQIMNTLHVGSCTCVQCNGRFPVVANGLPHSARLHEFTVPQSPTVMSLPMSDYAQKAGGGKIPIDRRTVSEYAHQHGGLAAVRRFGVPAPVASYYQRKDSVVGEPTGSPGPSGVDGNGHGNAQSSGSATQSPLLPSPHVLEMMKNAAHSSGSPGFLRGRGRGRPKLIGDELDADLVEYMVNVKKADPHHHLSAGNALEIAKAYILEKAPGLLEEHGGHVKLKLTWAMKLVQRIGERQREMELGLPPGTLQNMGKNQQLQEMMAYSQLGMQGGPPVHPMHNSALQDQVVSATPEITNVRELDLSNLFGSNGMDNDGDDGEGEEGDGQMFFGEDESVSLE